MSLILTTLKNLIKGYPERYLKIIPYNLDIYSNKNEQFKKLKDFFGYYYEK